MSASTEAASTYLPAKSIRAPRPCAAGTPRSAKWLRKRICVSLPGDMFRGVRDISIPDTHPLLVYRTIDRMNPLTQLARQGAVGVAPTAGGGVASLIHVRSRPDELVGEWCEMLALPRPISSRRKWLTGRPATRLCPNVQSLSPRVLVREVLRVIPEFASAMEVWVRTAVTRRAASLPNERVTCR